MCTIDILLFKTIQDRTSFFEVSKHEHPTFEEDSEIDKKSV